MVLETIPHRLSKEVSEDNPMVLSKYVTDELAFSLHLGGTRISHSKQKKVDELAKKINEKYGLGKLIEFDYPDLGLDFSLSSKYHFEPYSGVQEEGRILLTDSVGQLTKKSQRASEKRKRKANNKLRRIWGTDLSNIREFHNTIMEGGFYTLNHKARYLRNIQRLGITASLIGLVLANGVAQTKVTHEMINDPIRSEKFIKAVERAEVGSQNGCYSKINPKCFQ